MKKTLIGIFKFNYNQKKFPCYGYVEYNDSTYIIDKIGDANKSLENDIVEFDIYELDNNKVVIKSIIKRAKNNILGVLIINSKTLYGFTKKNIPYKKFKPINSKYPDFIVATKKNFQTDNVYAQIVFSDLTKNYFVGTLTNVFGNVGNFKDDYDFLKYRFEIKWNNRHSKFDLSKNLLDLTPDRKNLTDLNTISIDPNGCRDIDDALHFDYNDDKKTTEIGIHIADVSSFIEIESDLDKELMERISSVYLKNEQINMLPNELATNICSLRENEIRRSYSIILTFNESIEIINKEFTKSLIVNKKAMSYDEAENILLDKNHNYHKTLNELFNFAMKLKEKGIINSNFIDINDSFDTHKMVEVYMVLANSIVGKELFDKDKNNSIFRTHSFGNSDIYKHNDNIPKSIINVSNVLKMNSAEYVLGNNINLKHEGLNINYYTHFTSPIRRYVDILVHRLLYTNNDQIKRIKIDNKFCDKINSKNIKIKKAQRESYILDVIYNIYNYNNSIFETYGYIVSFKDNKVLVFINELNIIGESKLFSLKYSLKEKINYTINKDNNQIILISKDLDVLKLSLFDKIKIRIIISVKQIKIIDKFMIQIIEPDVSLFISKCL